MLVLVFMLTSWNSMLKISACRTEFIRSSNYAVILYQQKCPHLEAGSYQHLHLAASPVVALVNAPNYQALMGFAQGNLTEISSYEKTEGGEEKTENEKRTTFNPEFQFAPPKNDMPVFRMTAWLPQVSVSFGKDCIFYLWSFDPFTLLTFTGLWVKTVLVHSIVGTLSKWDKPFVILWFSSLESNFADVTQLARALISTSTSDCKLKVRWIPVSCRLHPCFLLTSNNRFGISLLSWQPGPNPL